MSETRTLLRDTAERLFDAHCTQDLRVRAEAGEWPAALWRLVTDVGLDLAAVPEALGGSEASLSDAAVVMRMAGRHAVPLPLVETMVGNWLLAEAGQRPLEGPLALAAVEGDPTLTLSRAGSHWVVTGRTRHVPWGHLATRVVAVARDGAGRQAVVQLPMQACALHPSSNQAGEPRDDVVFDAVRVEGAVFSLAGHHDFAAMLLEIGALARCQQMAGAMEWILERCCAYAGERVQFGKPIGGFQALQHMVAVMATQVSAASVAADAATEAFANGPADPAAGYAKARVGEAAGEVAALAHQLHGAMGYSHEYPLHWRTRRLWAWRDEFGSERFWNLRAGKLRARRGAANFWNDLAT